ncbi:MAG TPA: TolC family protein [Candidatus Acidoferrum sp.]|nr:TolC family protein [Candidatus Acidoferrum sp.]
MNRIVRPYISLLCVVLAAAPPTMFADPQQSGQPTPAPGSQPPMKEDNGLMGRITGPYRARMVPQNNLSNTPRLDALMRAGNLYLSLQDAIALALENNLDIAIQRYAPMLADTSVELAQAGGFARGVSTNVTAGPNSASINSAGTTAGITQSATAASSNASSSAVGGSVVQSSGPPLPQLDPILSSSFQWAHQTTAQSSAFVTGTNALIQRQNTGNFALTKGFLTGTTVSLGLNNTNAVSNNPRNDFNPSTVSSLGITVSQHLLQGFGFAVNSRQIRIAKNNREVSDLTFKLQVETTVAAVMDLYWDLVSFNKGVQVAKDALAASQQLLENNRRQVEVGTLAPIEVVRAEAEIASREQALTLADTSLLQQETILKTALSRTGVANPAIANARIIPTDQIRVPDVELITPIQEMVGQALSSRPELAQSRIQLQNQEYTVRGSKNALLPTLDIVATTSNSALAGEPNTLPPIAGTPRSNTAFFIGGYGTVLSQLFARNFPNYAIGFNFNVPLRNRAAQAQVLSDQLTYRQQQLALQRLENQVRVDVQNALIGVTQARAGYLSARKAEVLQQQTLDAEQKKLQLGASTIYNVILAERDLVTAQSNSLTAEASYAKARVELDRATGQILYNNSVSMDDAVKGVVPRPPSSIPATPPPPQQQQQKR